MTTMERIKQQRKILGVSQEELSRRAGVSLKTVQRWENGERSPNTLVMPKIAEALNTTVGYLMGIEDNRTVEPTKPSNELSPIMGEDKSDANNLVYEWGGGHKLRLPNTPETRKLFQEIVMRSMTVTPAMV